MSSSGKKGNLAYLAVIVILILGGFAYTTMAKGANKLPVAPTGNLIAESAPVDDIYAMFLCPCDGMPIDKNNPCCAMAVAVMKFIDSQLALGLSKNDAIIKTAEKYGLSSVAEQKRDAVKAELAKRNPDMFPKSKISFASVVGQKAPDFTLEAIDGGTVKLSEYKGKNVVLFFNEGSMCYPACWDQMAAFVRDERFNGGNTIAFSITPDPRSEWQAIVQKTPKLAGAKILFDSTRAVSTAYDVLSLPSSMHKGSNPGHTYFIIDKEGFVRYTLDDPRMAIQNDKLFNEITKLG